MCVCVCVSMHLCLCDPISHRRKILFIAGIFSSATLCASCAPFPARADLSRSLRRAALQTAASVLHLLQEPDENQSIHCDGLPTHNHKRIKCKCRALHSRSAASRICRDSQIIFREKHFTTLFPPLFPRFVAPKGRLCLYPIGADQEIYGASGASSSISCGRAAR